MQLLLCLLLTIGKNNVNSQPLIIAFQKKFRLYHYRG